MAMQIQFYGLDDGRSEVYFPELKAGLAVDVRRGGGVEHVFRDDGGHFLVLKLGDPSTAACHAEILLQALIWLLKEHEGVTVEMLRGSMLPDAGREGNLPAVTSR